MRRVLNLLKEFGKAVLSGRVAHLAKSWLTKENIENTLSKLNGEKFFFKFYSPQMRPFIHRSALAAMVALPAYLVGRMMAVSFKHPPPLEKGSSLALASPSQFNKSLQLVKKSSLLQSGGKGTSKSSAVIDCKATPKAPGCRPLKIPNEICEETKRSSLPSPHTALNDRSSRCEQIRGLH